jgi:phosphoglycolate phosphatase
LPPDLYLFDFDGTLADSFPWFGKVLNDVADRFGFRRVEEAEVETLRGWSAAQIIRHLGVPLWQLPRLGVHMRALMNDEIDAIPLFPGVDALLRTLAARGARLAVVTSNSEANVRRVLGPELAALVAHYECGASIFGKHAKFRRVLAAAGVAPARALALGDELRDLEAARKAGIPFGAVAWGYTRADALAAAGPDHLFGTVGAIADLA